MVAPEQATAGQALQAPPETDPTLLLLDVHQQDLSLAGKALPAILLSYTSKSSTIPPGWQLASLALLIP